MAGEEEEREEVRERERKRERKGEERNEKIWGREERRMETKDKRQTISLSESSRFP